MKNVVFIPNVDLGNGRSTPYHYSVKSWKKWCDMNGVEFIEWTEPITDVSHFKITLQRYWVHDILEHNGIDYDQVLIVDADTIIHPNTPNFFNETEDKYCLVHDDGSYDWILRGMEHYSKYVFNYAWFDFWKYGNSGFQIVNKKHRPFFDYMRNFYFDNKENKTTVRNRVVN